MIDTAPQRRLASDSQPSTVLDLSVVIPAINEAPNLRMLLPQLHEALRQLNVAYEIIVVGEDGDDPTCQAAGECDALVLHQQERGYGGALIAGFAAASGRYILTMDADHSHPPDFIRDLWARRRRAAITIASRYVPGGGADMPVGRYLLSRVLNTVFSRGLSLKVCDMSSGFRLYYAEALRGHSFGARDFDILQEILVRAYADGWQVQEVPFSYSPRQHGHSNAHIFQFGLAYLRGFPALWRLRNSILSADYDHRAYQSVIPLQRYWQQKRFQLLTRLIAGQSKVLDVGSGSSRVIGALPAGSVAVDLLLRKLRFACRYRRHLVQASGERLPFADASFPCVMCSEVIEHVPKQSSLLDELVRVVQPGGRLIIGTPDYGGLVWPALEWFYGKLAPGGYAEEHISPYTRNELFSLMRRRGLTLEEYHYILRGELIAAFRRPEAEA